MNNAIFKFYILFLNVILSFSFRNLEMELASDLDETSEQRTTYKKSLNSETNLEFHQKRFNDILEASVSDKLCVNTESSTTEIKMEPKGFEPSEIENHNLNGSLEERSDGLDPKRNKVKKIRKGRYLKCNTGFKCSKCTFVATTQFHIDQHMKGKYLI